MGDDRNVDQVADFVYVTYVSAPLVTTDPHPPGAAPQIATLYGFSDIGARHGRTDGPVHSVGAVLQLQRARVAADRDSAVVDGDHEIVQSGRAERGRLDHFTPAAHIHRWRGVWDD